MAHKGSPYKVQFRRDLHVDLPNKQGWAEAYDIYWRLLGGPIGSLVQGVTFQCVNLLKDAQPPMVWTSDHVAIFGRSYVMQLKVPVPTARPNTPADFRVTLTEATAGLVVDALFHAHAFNPQGMDDTARDSDCFFAPGYSAVFSQVEIVVPPATYASYNP